MRLECQILLKLLPLDLLAGSTPGATMQPCEAERSPVRFHLHKSNPQSPEVIEANCCRYLRPVPIDQRSASLVFADRGILSFDFLHQGLSSGAVPLDFVDFLCSGTNVTTTDYIDSKRSLNRSRIPKISRSN